MNKATATFEYIIDSNNIIKSEVYYSNCVSTIVNIANLTVNNNPDVKFADLNDTIIYKFYIENTGGAPANNILFKDPLSSNVIFKKGSVKINDEAYALYDPTTSGVKINSIPPGNHISLSFEAIVTSLTNGSSKNMAHVTYEYGENPSIIANVDSNEVTIMLNNATIVSTKTYNNHFINPEDIFTCCIELNNIGNVPANNINFLNVLPNNIQFIPNTFKINSNIKPYANPNNGILLDTTILPNNTIIISFDAKVLDLEKEEPIKNTFTTTYSYIVDPNQIEKQATYTNHIFFVPTNSNASLILKSNIDKNKAILNDILTYTVYVENIGNLEATDIILNSTLTSELQFKPNSLLLNGTNYSSKNPTINSGINIGNLAPKTFITITFKAIVVSTTNNLCKITSNTNYKYKIKPSNTLPISKTSPTEESTAKLLNVNLTSIKTINKNFLDVGETFTYSTILKNTGDIDITDMKFRDCLPDNMEFISNTFKVNSVVNPGADPTRGVYIDTIICPENSTTISFDAKVLSWENQNFESSASSISYKYISPSDNEKKDGFTISNTISNPKVNSAFLIFKSSVDKNISILNDVLTYTINIENTGNTIANDITISSILTSEIQFKIGSVLINGISYIDKDPTIISGMNIGDLKPQCSSTVTFQAVVISTCAGSCKEISNVSYNYKVSPIDNTNSKTCTCLENTTTLLNLDIISTKTANKDFVDIGEIFTYFIPIKNMSDIDIANVLFKDDLPSNIEFIPNTLKINSIIQTNKNPNDGIPINLIKKQSSFNISFDVKALDLTSSLPIESNATLKFNYKLNSINSAQIGTISIPCINTTKINNANLVITSNVDKNKATLNDILTYTITIKNIGNIDATDIIVKSILTPQLKFQSDSITINGINDNSKNPTIDSGINLKALSPNSIMTITFKALVISTISNSCSQCCTIDYHYKVDPNDIEISKTYTTRKNITDLLSVKLNSIKTCNKTVVSIGEIFSYSVSLENDGDMDITNVVFKDILPSNIEFIPNTFKENNVVRCNEIPKNGILLKPIKHGTNTIVSFQVKALDIHCPNYTENFSTTTYVYRIDSHSVPHYSESTSPIVKFPNILNAKLHLDINADKKINSKCNNLLYTITLKNLGNTLASNVIIKCNYSSNIVLDKNSLKVNYFLNDEFNKTLKKSNHLINTLLVNKEDSEDNHSNSDKYFITTINMETVNPNETVIISFDTKIVSSNNKTVENSTEVTYNYRISPSSQPINVTYNCDKLITEF